MPFTVTSPAQRAIPTIPRSFGVVCYEVFSFGKVPYHGRTNEEVMDEVPVGRRLKQPRLCPDAVFALMLQTWAHKDTARPGFPMLAECLLDIRDRLANGVDDPDLICSQATALMRERGGAHQIYHDEVRDSGVGP